MKPLFFCRKCLVKTMCNQKCDHIRSILHVLTIIQNSLLVTICLSWAMGFGLMMVMPDFKKIVAGLFSITLVGSISTTSYLGNVKEKINDRFNRV